jgi:hypothetical protein
VIDWPELTRDMGDAVGPELDRQGGTLERSGTQEFSRPAPDAEFLGQLAFKALLGVLPYFELSARKFPQSPEAEALAAAGDEDLPGLLNDSGHDGAEPSLIRTLAHRTHTRLMLVQAPRDDKAGPDDGLRDLC